MMISRLEKYLYKFLVAFTEFLVLVLLFLIAGQIISRQFGLRWLAPPDEIMTLFFAWLAFIGTALMVRDNGHLRAGVFDDFLEKKPQFKKTYLILINVLILIFEVVMFHSSLTLFELGTMKTSPMLQWPESIWYFPVMVSAFLMLFYTIIKLVQIIFKNNVKTATEENMINTF